MKTKINITALLIILSYSFSYAQEDSLTAEQWLNECKKEVNNTAYVFEGTVIKQDNYEGKDEIVTTCIMQITKIYTGSPKLKLGTIKLITSRKFKNAFGPIEGYIVPIGKGGAYIIFGGNALSVDTSKTDNTITLTSCGMYYPIVIHPDNSVSWYGTPQFKTKEDIYSFFKENGLSVQEETQEK